MMGMYANPVADKERNGVVKKELMALGVVAMMAVAMVVMASPAHAQSTTNTITVNSVNDETNPEDGDCTLREAITSANSNSTSGDATNECAAGSSTAPDHIVFNVTGKVNLARALPSLSGSVRIEGPGADQLTVRRDTGGDYRIFTVTSGSVVYISGITISNGNTSLSSSGGVDGGGIYNDKGTLTISGSTISGNSASVGGGVFSATNLSSAQKTTITNSTVSGNTATRTGGGFYNIDGLTVIEHSTITKNTAPRDQGSGVASWGDNSPSTEVLSTIISANTNTDVDVVVPFGGDTTNSFHSKGYNLIGSGDATSAFDQTGDQPNVTDPKLGDLTDNGGPTQTHALEPGSPAIDRGDTTLATDQRGVKRPQGGADDAGAFELDNAAPVAKPDSYTTNEDTPLTVAAPDGVLANDTDSDTDDTLEAVLVNGPSNAASFELKADGSFSYAPKANYNGPDSFTYKASDGTDDSNTATVNITINPVNDAPGFAKGADQTVNEDAGAQSVPNWATNISAGPSDESGQQVSFDATNDNNSLFTAAGQPKVSPGGTLTYTSAKDASGKATVTVKATDDGGTEGGGVDTSAAKTFTITVNPINDAPTVEVAAEGQCGTSGSSGRINLTVGDLESAPSALTLSATSSNQNLVPNSGLSVGGSGASRTLTVSAAARRSGTATITVRASDGQTNGTVPVTVKVGSDGSDTLGGTPGADIIFGKNGANSTTGQGGNDLLCGGNGSDVMSGGAGDDTLDGANGNDALRGNAGRDILRGSAGDDTLTGGTEADSFDGGSGTDTATDYNAAEGDARTNIP